MSSQHQTSYHFLLGLCVSADAAAVFAAALDRGFLRTLAAADAALALVTSLFDLRGNKLTSLLIV